MFSHNTHKALTPVLLVQEHSIEMQLPYLAHLTKGYLPFTATIVYLIPLNVNRSLMYPFIRRDVALVPIMVGSVDARSEAKYGEILAPYLDDPANLFVISSDFCHWGNRYIPSSNHA